MKESYRKTDKLPFGSFVAYEGFQHIFYKNRIQTATIPFDETWKNIKAGSGNGYSLYFLVSKNLVLRTAEINALINYVKEGNDLFISADYIDKKLLDAFYCRVDRRPEKISEARGKMKETNVSMYFGDAFDAPRYRYYYFPFLNSIAGYDTSSARILGVNETGKPNYVIFFLGDGRVYLHVAPRIFSNYFLLTNNNYQYFDNVISYLRLNPANIYWDEYYKSASGNRYKSDLNEDKHPEHFASLRVIQQYRSLRWAFWLAVAGILLYMIFTLKRKQRVIEVIRPNSNDTAAFVETVGQLYFQQKNNRHIAGKMITYFYEHIRNKYFINATSINNDFISSLSGKSGVPRKQTGELFKLMQNIQSKENISDEELIELSTQIEKFN